jgi:CubicO group peptidase (beta-lactamase class C family)
MLSASRGLLIAFAIALSATTAAAECPTPPGINDGWEVASPATVGLDGDRVCGLGAKIDAQKEMDVHALLVARHGKLVFEQYFSGADERWGTPVRDDAHSRDRLHDARSVTKSVVALVLGAAIDRGLLKLPNGLDTPVFDLLPEYVDLRTDEKQRITVRHLLTMSAGLQWDEDIPYGDARNSETQMDRASDPARFVLSQPTVTLPGEVYNYSGGSAVLIQAILQHATERSLDALANELLFAPLGITEVDWIRYPATGEPIAASGLRLLPRDFAKIGQLVLTDGMWNSRQIVPAEFIVQATSPQINGQGIYFYGYQFWLGRSFMRGDEIDWAAAVGLGGQRIYIIPTLDLVVIVNAGLYHSPRQAWVPLALLNGVLAASSPSSP